MGERRIGNKGYDKFEAWSKSFDNKCYKILQKFFKCYRE